MTCHDLPGSQGTESKNKRWIPNTYGNFSGRLGATPSETPMQFLFGYDLFSSEELVKNIALKAAT